MQWMLYIFVSWCLFPRSSCCISISIGINSTWWFVVVVLQLLCPDTCVVQFLVLLCSGFCVVFLCKLCVWSPVEVSSKASNLYLCFFLPCVVVAVLGTVEITSHYALLVLGIWYSVVKVLVAFCRSFSARLTSRCIIGLSLALLAHSAPAAEKWFSERKIVR